MKTAAAEETSVKYPVQYNHSIRLYAKSGYANGAAHSAESSASSFQDSLSSRSISSGGDCTSPTSSTSSSTDQQWSLSSSTDLDLESGGYIGFYEKRGRHGILSCIPPLGPALENLFQEEVYSIVAPTANPENQDLHSGDSVVLVNQFGYTWNNKTGGITGYIGPRKRHLSGEMHITFIPTVNVSETKKAPHPVIHYGDQVQIHIVSSNRHSTKYDKPLTEFKKSTSRIAGGYICCDGKGLPLVFTIHPMAPRITSISGPLFASVNNDDTTSVLEWGARIIVRQVPEAFVDSVEKKDVTVDHRSDRPDLALQLIELKLSNDGVILLTWDDILAHYHSQEPFFRLAKGSAGGILFLVTSSEQLLQTRSNSFAWPSEPIKNISYWNNRSTCILAALVVIFLIMYMMTGLGLPITILALVVSKFYYGVPTISNSGEQTHQEAELKPGQALEDESMRLILVCHSWAYDVSMIKKNDINFEDLIVVGPNTSTVPTVPMPGRFLAATKGDELAAIKRWKATLEWRKTDKMDTILTRPHAFFDQIKTHYPHYFHLRGRQDEPVYYEFPAKVDLRALKKTGCTIDTLLRHYAFITEFLWTRLEPSESGKSITVIDMDGIGMRDFAGEVVDFVRRSANFIGQHYPERAAFIFIINVPSWFKYVEHSHELNCEYQT